ncbi:MAG TPA: L-seryl-tRNA(Sec) selenium transferase [Rhodocyclaceae bacterium]|nr:L-seryl-tRNA(Sec) selenium transferase [Rhodocyclaceae bacterium]
MIPSLDRLLKLDRVDDLVASYGRSQVTEVARTVLSELRAQLSRNPTAKPGFDPARFVADCRARLEHELAPSLRAVFNLTGTVLHTNLGRATLPLEAVQAVVLAMTRAVNLEYRLDDGRRGERDHHVERWLTRLTGAEAALVVNNNAAAVYLMLNTLALRKEVAVSRGELIEIGGSFRIPDIMARAGCKLREVGTTNRTHLKDYLGAICARSAALMKVHTSNYTIQGFTSTVHEDALAELAHRHGLALIVDLGSGTLVDLEDHGLPHELTPREVLARGADLVSFSGDKLLGGPQAGLIVGRADLIERIRANPMKRALRVDKMTLAALEAVLKLYANPGRLCASLPALKWLSRPLADIKAQAERLLPALSAALGPRARAVVLDCKSQIGSGSLPLDLLASAGIGLSVESRRKNAIAAGFASAFRALPTPVIGRVNDGVFIMDFRCLDDEAGFVGQLGHLALESP